LEPFPEEIAVKNSLRPRELLMRCFAERIDGQWQAFCVDLNLAAQADSVAEVKAKLDSMIESYLFDALSGDDQEHAGDLLNRRAPVDIMVRYYWTKLRVRFAAIKHRASKNAKAYQKSLPLTVAHC